jgi:hypothetical protein
MGEFVDINEFKKRKETGSTRKDDETPTIGVFSLLLGPDAPEGLKNYIKQLEGEKDEGK